MRRAITILLALVMALSLAACGSGNESKNTYDYNSPRSSYNTQKAQTYELDHASYCMLYMKISNVTVTHKRNYTYVNGTITNTGTYQIKYVKVKAACKDYLGTVIDTDWTYAVDSTWLAPGESKQFEMMIKDEMYKIKKADVTIIYE